MIPQVNMLPSPIQPTPLPFDNKVDLVKRVISAPDGWKALAQSIKQSNNPSARIECLSILKKIAQSRAITYTGKDSAQEIFADLVKTLDQHLNQP